MNNWRVTKYDPKLRNSRGAFEGDDWIMMSDIGSVFNGKPLTLEEYLKTEDRYITVLHKQLRASNVPYLCVKQLQKPIVEATTKDLADKHSLYEKTDLEEGQQLEIKEALRIVRLILREFVWCKLEFDNRFYVHIGWDYYMYVGTTLKDSEFVMSLKDSGLYAEHFESPYK